MNYKKPKYKLNDIVVIRDEKKIDNWDIYLQGKITSATYVDTKDTSKRGWTYVIETKHSLSTLDESEIITVLK